jgi:hypothetical protein
MATLLDNLLIELGYRRSPFYREAFEHADTSITHLLRDARRAHVCGSYFIRTSGDDTGAARERPAVHVAEAGTPDEARKIHRQLWNQGTTPFLLVSLPGQVRVYTGFAYDGTDDTVGQVEGPLDGTSLSLGEIAERLNFLRAESIDSGDIWRTKGAHLTKDKRVDRLLLRTLRSLSQHLVLDHHLDRKVAHALIGRFVYLYYLRERDILSNQWLDGVGVDPNAVFSADATLGAFRRLTDKVDDRFNGRIFPIDWATSSAPRAEAVRTVARAFAGEDPTTGQMALFRPFDFSFIPIELLSAIYEQFLRDEGRGAKEGAFYTSEPVADYLIAEVESVKPMERGMRVLDPCCGSGIFLVLSYRRLIEQELRRRKASKLLPTELRDILTKSIFGVERNSEACLVTEFNLVLTLVSYIDPPELHRHTAFRFPTLHNEQLFESDFFDDHSRFWKADQRFDWIIGNPPWIELNPRDEKEQLAVAWIQRARKLGVTPVARYRSSEAFTWRARERLADGGVAGFITQATSLTNDQSADYRRAFFKENIVHRISNLSNLAYVLFESAEEPAATIAYSVGKADAARPDIVHFGPLVVNQPATAPDQSRRRRAPWVLTIFDSEIQTVQVAEASRGAGTTWKRALWGNPRDRRAIERVRRILPTTLGYLAYERGWHLNLGLQLRADRGSKSEPNQDVAEIRQHQGVTESEARRFARWFSGLKVMEPKRLRNSRTRLTVQSDWLVRNRWGTFVRQGRDVGLNVISAPHIFLWNDFAAFSEHDFILRHPKLGLSGPLADVDRLRAVSVIWTSSITPYLLFLDLSAGWGISRSTIDLGDARQMPMPNLTDDLVGELASLHRSLAMEEANLGDRNDWQRRLDEGVASALKIPAQVMLLAREFVNFRLPLVKGKAPREVTRSPDQRQLETYARRLKSELDGFLGHEGRRHQVTVLSAPPAGIVATIDLVSNGQSAKPTVRIAAGDQEKHVRDILHAAEQEFSQWVYVRRSVRVFAGSRIHLCKPLRRLEWTETQALLDAADIIAEVAEARGHEA